MMKPRGDGEPRVDGEGSHWFCGCVPGAQECHCHDCLLAQREEARLQLEQVLAERDNLRAALEQYGRHEPLCDWGARQIEELACTCGFSEALNESEEAVSPD